MAGRRALHRAARARSSRRCSSRSGGPILMVQIENEYGSYGNDRAYMARLETVWSEHGIDVPFFTADGPTPYMLEAGTCPARAVGLDSGSTRSTGSSRGRSCPACRSSRRRPIPGWLTHWGEQWARPSLDDLLKEVTFLLGEQEVVQLLRRARRHELRLHGRREFRRQGLRARRHELRLRRADQRAGPRRRRSTRRCAS